jgi:hypothetical protein
MVCTLMAPCIIGRQSNIAVKSEKIFLMIKNLKVKHILIPLQRYNNNCIHASKKYKRRIKFAYMDFFVYLCAEFKFAYLDSEKNESYKLLR